MVRMPAKERMIEVVTVVQLGMTTDGQKEDQVVKRTAREKEKRNAAVREIVIGRDAATGMRLCVVPPHEEKIPVALQAPLTGQMTFLVAKGPVIPERRIPPIETQKDRRGNVIRRKKETAEIGQLVKRRRTIGTASAAVNEMRRTRQVLHPEMLTVKGKVALLLHHQVLVL